jgi:Ca2+-binding RTX toxin-like protein
MAAITREPKSLKINMILGTPDPDVLTGTNKDDRIRALGGKDKVFGKQGDDFLGGGQGQDTLYGGSGSDNIEGHKGNDLIFGGNGFDLIDGGQGDDHIFGDQDMDILIGDRGNDVIEGGQGVDFLLGGIGDDTLVGGNGRDAILGDVGRDQIIGGGGSDRFWMVSGPGIDIIQDYQDGQDEFWISGLWLSSKELYQNLDIIQRNENVVIQLEEDKLAKIKGVQASSIKANDFEVYNPLFFTTTFLENNSALLN